MIFKINAEQIPNSFMHMYLNFSALLRSEILKWEIGLLFPYRIVYKSRYLTVIWRNSFVDKLQEFFGCCLNGLLRSLHHDGLKKKRKM